MIVRMLRLFERKYGLIVFGLGLLLLAGGIVYSIYLGDTLRYLPDESDYTLLARGLVTKGIYSLDGIHPTAYRAPGYPMVLAFFSLFGLGVTGFRILNFVFLAASIWLASRIAFSEAGWLAGILAAVFMAAYGVLFYTAGTLYPQILAMFLLLVGLRLWTKPEASLLNYLTGGLALAGMVLAVPTFIYIPLVIAAWQVLSSRRMSSRLAAGLAVVVLVVGLWVGRNALVFHSFVFVASNSGENLLLGNSENTTPNGGAGADIQAYVQAADRLKLDEVQRDRFYGQQALEYIQNHKLASLRLYLLKFVNFFNYRNQLVTASESSPAKDWFMLFTYGPLICVFFLRWLLIKWYRPAALDVLFFGLYILGGLVQAIFFTRIRFRLPLDVLVILTVAIFLGRGILRWAGSREH